MPVMQTVLSRLNADFGRENIREFARREGERFAPGQSVVEALADAGAERGELHEAFKSYLGKIPGGITEALRATVHYALTTSPPTMITFAWAPAYDYEIDIWQAPDTKATKGGITVLFKSRYPDDAHPLSR